MDAKRAIRFLTPGVAISVTGVICSAACGGFSETRGVSPLQPPSWVFSVVWPILFVTTGIAWVLSKEDVFIGATVALCCVWLPVHLCGKYRAVSFTVLCMAAVLAWAATARIKGVARYYMLPLALWLSFACVLNATTN